ncbi:MAG: tripartite tricarboxylate transporter substrate binding protein [Burkholderiaceae bacterium]
MKTYGLVLAFTRVVAFLTLCAANVHAQPAYPSKPIKLVVGFSAGSATDKAARILADRLSPILGQQLVVENRPGASSFIATEAVANAAPDGYTILFSSSSATVITASRDNAQTRAYKSLVPVAQVANTPCILVVHPSLGVKSVWEFIALAKSKPDGISYASSGPGSSPHMSAELFSSVTGVKMLHVPYKGSSGALNDLLPGLVPVMFSPASSVLPHIKSGKLIALATTGSQSISQLGIPTLSESGLPGFSLSLWFGVLAPKGTDPALVQKLASAIEKAQADPETNKQLSTLDMSVMKAGPVEFGAFINSEIARWSVLIKVNNIVIN